MATSTAALGPELLRRTAIVPRGLRPEREATEVRLRVLAPAGIALVEDTHQRASDGGASGRYTVIASSVNTSAPSALRGGFPDRAVRDEDLLPDPLVQSDDPRIITQAQAIVATVGPTASVGPAAAAGNSFERAAAIHDWVFTYIDKEPMLSIPSAVEVLTQRRGDCNEHTVLYTALARAVGLPTRIAIGVVWSDALDGFYYHAWPEVWVEVAGAGRWHRFDPTLGQVAADATHLKLLEGGILSWPGLLAYLGKLELEVEAVEMGRETSP
jgi:transglutaminase-like putative cysteine protease